MICRIGSDGRQENIREISPPLHIGIGAGRLWAAALGEEPTWTLIAGGEGITQAAAAQAIARSWSYVISAEAQRELTRGIAEAQLPARHTLDLCSLTPSADWLAGFLPTQVRELLLSVNSRSPSVRGLLALDLGPSQALDVQLAALHEIRPISVVFVRVVGLNCGDSDALSQHQALWASLQEIVRSRDGPPGNLFYDEQGPRLFYGFRRPRQLSPR